MSAKITYYYASVSSSMEVCIVHNLYTVTVSEVVGVAKTINKVKCVTLTSVFTIMRSLRAESCFMYFEEKNDCNELRCWFL